MLTVRPRAQAPPGSAAHRDNATPLAGPVSNALAFTQLVSVLRRHHETADGRPERPALGVLNRRRAPPAQPVAGSTSFTAPQSPGPSRGDWTTNIGLLLVVQLAHLRTSIATIACMAVRSSAGPHPGDSLVATATARRDAAGRRKQRDAPDWAIEKKRAGHLPWARATQRDGAGVGRAIVKAVVADPWRDALLAGSRADQPRRSRRRLPRQTSKFAC
jgi:hypothetical protein